MTEQTTFPNISQVNASTLNTLVAYFNSKVSCFKAGRLTLFYDRWSSLTSDAEVLGMVSGQRLEFTHQPFQLHLPRDKSTDSCWDSDQAHTCELEIQNLLKKGAIVHCNHEKGEYISPIFTTSKKDGSSRMILNLRSLNRFIEYRHFKMESFSTIVNMVKPNCYMASIDLKDAYYSVPIATEHQKYLKFSWEGQLYKFVCFPNGLAFCPRKFTKLLKPVNSHLRQLGHISVSHIDDSYLQGDDYEDCATNVLDTTRLLDDLGFIIHPDKSSFIPSQEITILGFKINSVLMKVFPTMEKIAKIKAACSELLNTSSPSIRQVASVLGLLISNFPAAQFGPLHFRDLDMDKTRALKCNQGNFDRPMQLSEVSCADLRWWINSADSLYKPIALPQPDATLFADASNQGWGGVLGKERSGGQWTTHEATHHINYLEILAVFFALKAFQTHLLGKHVCVRIDNMTAVSNIGKMGTSHSRICNTLVREIWGWCIDHDIFLTTAHIPGVENEAADAESRKPLKETEWALDQNIYQQGIQLLKINPDIDLFASRLNYKVKPFIAYQPDPEAQAVNAFSISWKSYLFYAFPPFSIISLVLQKIREEQSTGLIVVPKWPAQPWWPYLMRMVIQIPVVLPNKENTVYMPSKPELVHPLYPKLTLLMCHVSGSPSKIEGFQRKLCRSSCHHGEKVRKDSIHLTSKDGGGTVVQGNWIPFQQL